MMLTTDILSSDTYALLAGTKISYSSKLIKLILSEKEQLSLEKNEYTRACYSDQNQEWHIYHYRVPITETMCISVSGDNYGKEYRIHLEAGEILDIAHLSKFYNTHIFGAKSKNFLQFIIDGQLCTLSVDYNSLIQVTLSTKINNLETIFEDLVCQPHTY